MSKPHLDMKYTRPVFIIKAYEARNIRIHDLICNDTSLLTAIHSELYIFAKCFSYNPATLFSGIPNRNAVQPNTMHVQKLEVSNK